MQTAQEPAYTRQTAAQALDPKVLHTAQTAQAALDLLRWHYADLLLRHDALLKQYDRLERTTHRVLDVLAILEEKTELGFCGQPDLVVSMGR